MPAFSIIDPGGKASRMMRARRVVPAFSIYAGALREATVWNGGGASGSCCSVKALGDPCGGVGLLKGSHMTGRIGSVQKAQDKRQSLVSAGSAATTRPTILTIRSLPIEQWGRDLAA